MAREHTIFTVQHFKKAADPSENGQRVRVAKETFEYITVPENLAQLEQDAENNHLRWADNPESAAPAPGAPARIRVREEDWGIVASDMIKKYGARVGFLNLANAFSPGGGWLAGAAAQEENSFRRTTASLHITPSVTKKEGRYKKEYTDLINGLNPSTPEEDTVFVEQNLVICFRGPEIREVHPDGSVTIKGYALLPKDEIFSYIEIRLAAENLVERDANSRFIKIKPFNAEEFRTKIIHLLDTAIRNKIEYLVLGALGCGAFANPPKEVAKIFFEELVLRKDKFKGIDFAVYCPRATDWPNFIAFHQELKKYNASVFPQEEKEAKEEEITPAEAIRRVNMKRNRAAHVSGRVVSADVQAPYAPVSVSDEMGEALDQEGSHFSIETHARYEERTREQIGLLIATAEGGARVLCLQKAPYKNLDPIRRRIFQRVLAEYSFEIAAERNGSDLVTAVLSEEKADFIPVAFPLLQKQVEGNLFHGTAIQDKTGLYIHIHAYPEQCMHEGGGGMDACIEHLCALRKMAYTYATENNLMLYITGNLSLPGLTKGQRHRLQQEGDFQVEPVMGQRMHPNPTYEAWYTPTSREAQLAVIRDFIETVRAEETIALQTSHLDANLQRYVFVSENKEKAAMAAERYKNAIQAFFGVKEKRADRADLAADEEKGEAAALGADHIRIIQHRQYEGGPICPAFSVSTEQYTALKTACYPEEVGLVGYAEKKIFLCQRFREICAQEAAAGIVPMQPTAVTMQKILESLRGKKSMFSGLRFLTQQKDPEKGVREALSGIITFAQTPLDILAATRLAVEYEIGDTPSLIACLDVMEKQNAAAAAERADPSLRPGFISR